MRINDIYRRTCEPYLRDYRGIFTGAAERLSIQPQALSDALRGLPEELVLVYGKGGCGKTDLLINVMLSALSSRRVIMLSLEIGVKPVLRRALSCLSAMLDFGAALTAEDFAAADLPQGKAECRARTLAAAGALFSDLVVVTDGEDVADAITAEGLRASVRAIRQAYGVAPVVIVDYVQLMGVRGQAYSTTEQVDRVSRTLASIAHLEETPVLAVSSVGKDGSIRSSSQLQHDAGVILRLTSDGACDDGGYRGMTIEIEKNRDGESRCELDLGYWPAVHYMSD